MKNKDELIRYIDMCQASLAESTSNDYIQNHGIDGETFDFKETDVEGFWMEDVENVYIVFRSTELKTKEILENFNFISAGVKCEKVTISRMSNDEYDDQVITFGAYSSMGKKRKHRGVAKKVDKKVESYVLDVIRRGFDSGKPVKMIGHSLGGAIARDIARHSRNKLRIQFEAKNYMLENDKIGLLGKIYEFLCGYNDKFIYLKNEGCYSMENHNLVAYREVIENA